MIGGYVFWKFNGRDRVTNLLRVSEFLAKLLNQSLVSIQHLKIARIDLILVAVQFVLDVAQDARKVLSSL